MKPENIEKVKIVCYSLAMAVKENLWHLLYKMNSWDGLGVILYIFLDAILIGINVPSFLCGFNALKYLKNENNTIHRRLSIVFGVISLLIQFISIYVVFTTVSFDYNSQEDKQKIVLKYVTT